MISEISNHLHHLNESRDLFKNDFTAKLAFKIVIADYQMDINKKKEDLCYGLSLGIIYWRIGTNPPIIHLFFSKINN